MIGEKLDGKPGQLAEKTKKSGINVPSKLGEPDANDALNRN